MRSYLSLIPISVKVHKQQYRMTRLCIVLSVLLVTAIFSMAEMGVKIEMSRLLEKHGTISFRDMLSNTMVQTLFLVASILFILILLAGILMIASSINSNVVQRTKFFGMMRCIGMSKEQIIHFVRLEALNWCKIAVPIGVACGIVVTWILCFILRFRVGNEFSNIPLFRVSFIGIVFGILVGVTTVLIATSSPARRAAKVSPIVAVSGHNTNNKNSSCFVDICSFPMETALGVSHATLEKKNLLLMTGSFTLSIILFLAFLVFIDFVGYLMPQSISSPDIIISSKDSTNSIDKHLLNAIRHIDGVKQVFGRRSSLNRFAQLKKNDTHSNLVDIISYDEFELRGLVKDNMLQKGSDISKVLDNSKYVLATWDKNSSFVIGDKIWINNIELEIAGLLKYDPFSNNGLTNGKITLITSNNTFTRLTGVSNYSIIMAQVTSDISEQEINSISNLIDINCIFHDKREQQTNKVYMIFIFCVYGFLAIIILVAVINIMNNISMSVSAKIKQYGIMRAIGMDEHQVTKMVISETFTYAIIGTILGCSIGVLIHRWIYTTLITSHFSYATWSIPIVPLLAIIISVLCTVFLASYIPLKYMKNISITEIINKI